MDSSTIDFATVVPKFDAIVARGFSTGVGTRNGQMCVEAAICAALDLPHGDDPACVDPAVRRFKIRLNDSSWSSPEARAKGLRDLGIAQLGSRGTIDSQVFVAKLAEQTIRRLIPALLRAVLPSDAKVLEAADRCEREGTRDAAARAAYAADAAAYAADALDAATRAAYAADAAAYAADAAARAADAVDAADAARDAAYAARDAAYAARADKYLLLSASIALDVLRELKSPGAVWLDAQAA